MRIHDIDSCDSAFSVESFREIRHRNRFKRRGTGRADESRSRDQARVVAARDGRHIEFGGM